MTYVNVAITKQHSGDSFFSYHTEETIAIGQLVEVPYGRTSARGIVVAIVKKPTFATKQITTILPYALPRPSLELLHFMLSFYSDDYGTISQLFIPNNFARKPQAKEANVHHGDGEPLQNPTPEQSVALDIINEPSNNRILLHGDTGTGKTRVYTEAAIKHLKAGESVLILTPEIGLTPQLIADVKKYIDAPIVVSHSQLTPVERRRVWEYAASNKNPTLYIGPRSTLFLPFNQKIGLIVVDEAHDASYKQNNSPRYQSLHIAAKLANIHKSQLIQSTATPNVDDYYIAQKNGYKIIRMKTPAAGSLQSTTQIIDITNRDLFKTSQYIADEAVDAINNRLQLGEQTMIFLNRRGSARLIQCAQCGWQALCPRCGLPLTYHHDIHIMRCHSCNYKANSPSSCPKCHGTDLAYKSIGTKSLAEHVQQLFPKANIMRFDADSTASEQLHRNVDKLKNGKVDIIIGTQLISKGIDLPKLSLVIITNADTGLNMPDYRAEETTFQQIYQVTGRVGRGHKLSKSFIQTRLPENPVMEAALKRSWEQYYAYELHKRKQFSYPPFCYLAIYKIYKKSPKSAEAAAEKGFNKINQLSGISLLGPSPSFYEKINDEYCWHIIAKSSKRSLLLQAAKQLPSGWIVDLDPTSLL